MINEICILLLFVVLGGVLLYRAKITDTCNDFFDKNWSLALKGLCCIVVILVHIPNEHSTRLQNMMGSFAFVAVTVFFMISGYGLSVNRNRKGYMQHFWRNRMVTLIVPMLLTNIVAEVVNLISGVTDHIVYNLFAVNGFVVMITACYVIFYIANQFKSLNEHMKSIITCLGILVLSIFAFLFENHIPFTVWPVPCLGFIYGILIADHRTQIIEVLNKQKIVDAKTILLILASIVIGGGYAKAKHIFFWGDYVLRACLAIVLIALLIKITAYIRFESKAALALGTISYEVYLSHVIVIELFTSYCGSLNSGMYVVGVVVVTLVLSYIIHKVDQKIIVQLRA